MEQFYYSIYKFEVAFLSADLPNIKLFAMLIAAASVIYRNHAVWIVNQQIHKKYCNRLWLMKLSMDIWQVTYCSSKCHIGAAESLLEQQNL